MRFCEVKRSAYVDDLLIENKYEQLKATNTPLEVSIELEPPGRDKLADLRTYRRQVGKLIYFTVTRPNILLQ